MTLLQNLLWFLDVRTGLLCVILILVLRWFFRKQKNLPPGPRGFPILGSIPALLWEIRRGMEPHEIFGRYAAKYGPVFHLKVLNKTLVVLNDYASVKEAFQHPQLNDRPRIILAEAMKSSGVASTSGKPWVELRRFCLTVFRRFGVGKSSFEEKIGTEAEELIKAISAYDGKTLDPKPLLYNAVSNVICSVVFGERYEYTDQEFNKLLCYIRRLTELLGTGGVIFFFPALRHLPFVTTDELMSIFEKFRKFLTNIVDAHRASFNATNLRDFTDVYLMEIEHQNIAKDKTGAQTNGTSPKSARHHGEMNIVGTISDLFLAGSETTSTTLQWGLLYMTVYPDIQKRVQAEIDTVVGRNRLPRMADKPELNFTQAVLWEIQRLGNIVPLGLAHAAASDTQFRGFFIPKGALLVPNLWSVFQDPTVWPEPEQFKPERFLNADGKLIKAEGLIPFGTGRRSCIGEGLANMELFIFFSYFMHQFTVKKPDNSPPLSLKGKGGVTNSPETFDISFNKRD